MTLLRPQPCKILLPKQKRLGEIYTWFGSPPDLWNQFSLAYTVDGLQNKNIPLHDSFMNKDKNKLTLRNGNKQCTVYQNQHLQQSQPTDMPLEPSFEFNNSGKSRKGIERISITEHRTIYRFQNP